MQGEGRYHAVNATARGRDLPACMRFTAEEGTGLRFRVPLLVPCWIMRGSVSAEDMPGQMRHANRYEGKVGLLESGSVWLFL